jgi:hypothetical protein
VSKPSATNRSRYCDRPRLSSTGPSAVMKLG